MLAAHNVLGQEAGLLRMTLALETLSALVAVGDETIRGLMEALDVFHVPTDFLYSTEEYLR